jgi:hypothetical protein
MRREHRGLSISVSNGPILLRKSVEAGEEA